MDTQQIEVWFIFNFFKPFCFIFEDFLKITNNKNFGAASKIGEGGDEKHKYFFTLPKLIWGKKRD